MSQPVCDPWDRVPFCAASSPALVRPLRCDPSPQSTSKWCNFKRIMSSEDTHVCISVWYSSRCLPQRYTEIPFFPCFHPKEFDMATFYPAYKFPVLQEAVVRMSSLAMYQAGKLLLPDCWETADHCPENVYRSHQPYLSFWLISHSWRWRKSVLYSLQPRG